MNDSPQRILDEQRLDRERGEVGALERITLRLPSGVEEVTLPVTERVMKRSIEFGFIDYDGRRYRVWRHKRHKRWWDWNGRNHLPR